MVIPIIFAFINDLSLISKITNHIGNYNIGSNTPSPL